MPGDILIVRKHFIDTIDSVTEHSMHVGDIAVIVGEEHEGLLNVRSVACVTVLVACTGRTVQMTGWCIDHYWRLA